MPYNHLCFRDFLSQLRCLQPSWWRSVDFPPRTFPTSSCSHTSFFSSYNTPVRERAAPPPGHGMGQDHHPPAVRWRRAQAGMVCLPTGLSKTLLRATRHRPRVRLSWVPCIRPWVPLASGMMVRGVRGQERHRRAFSCQSTR